MYITWNAANLSRGSRELALSNLLVNNNVDIAIVTETELLPEATAFAVEGYTTFLPLVRSGAKVRLIALVKNSLSSSVSVCMDLMSNIVPTIWLELSRPGNKSVIGGVYRQWSDCGHSGMVMEREQLDIILTQVKAASEQYKSVTVMGDFNLDTFRPDDESYTRRALLHALIDGMALAGLEYWPTKYTYRSHGRYNGEHRLSCLDHVYDTGTTVAEVSVLSDSATDHRPVLIQCVDQKKCTSLKQIVQRNFKAINGRELRAALAMWDWDKLREIKDVNDALAYIVQGISVALDIVAPEKVITVRRGSDFSLASDTLEMIERRDSAPPSKYKHLRNQACALVKRDKMRSNLAKLREAGDCPKILWKLAGSALGKKPATLPASLFVNGVATTGNMEAAEAQNRYYIDKIDKLRDGIDKSLPPPPASDWPEFSIPFNFTFASAGKVAMVIKGLRPTGALGLDGIPVSVLKKGVEELAAPIAHLINCSLSSGVVPAAFKAAVVVPFFKGKGKCTTDPASYRPVSILPAMSKVLETIVKSDLERHLARTDALPNAQFGFRPGRSPTAALAMAQADWIKGRQKGQVVGVLGFDLSAAFDTINVDQLLPKLEAIGISGMALRWFHSYLTGGCQCVDWLGERSGFLDVKFGVRQGSILGPILYLIMVADLPGCIGIDESGNIIIYADDTAIWAMGKDISTVQSLLEKRSESMVRYAAACGLVLNATKTQLIVSGANKQDMVSFTVSVDGAAIKPAKTFELLGVTFNEKFATGPYEESLAKSAKQRAAMVVRLSHHIPRGVYLQELSRGLLMGKVGYAVAAVTAPRLDDRSPPPSAASKTVQVAINNTARTILGKRLDDHIRVPDLLHMSGLPSLNAMATRAVAMEAWKAFHSNDGPSGSRNPLGLVIFNQKSNCRMSRSTMTGQISCPLPISADTMVVHAATIWNRFPALRAATSKGAAFKAAKEISRSVPI